MMLPGFLFLERRAEVKWSFLLCFLAFNAQCPLAGGTQMLLSAASWGFLQKAAAGKVGRSLRDSVCVTQAVPTQPLPLCPSLC